MKFYFMSKKNYLYKQLRIELFLIEIDVALAVSGALAVPLSIVGVVIGTVAI